MANKKITELIEAFSIDGTEYAEIVQNGLNKKVLTSFYVTTREFGRAWDSELIFDKDEIAYEEYTLTGDIEYTVPESGHLSNHFCSIVQEIITDGTHTVTFTGFKYVIGDVQSGSIPEAGTYQVFFLYYNGVATANWSTPTSETAGLVPLSAPGSFAAVADGDTEIDLTWSNVTNNQGYRIDYSLNGSTGWTVLAVPAVDEVSYSHTGLTAGDQRFYRITALGDLVTFSNSPYSTDNATTEDVGDITAPTFTFLPADAATDIPINRPVTITCSEAIRDADGVTEITSANITDYLVVKEDDGAGANIPYTATINAGKTLITITPNIIWPLLGDVFIQISGVEDVNGNESATDDATFTNNDFTETNGNYLNFGDIMDSVIAANDTNFNIKWTAKSILLSGGATTLTFRKYAVGQESILMTTLNSNMKFKFYNVGTSNIVNREITWSGVLSSGEHDYEIEYDGAIDTNNGLDRLKFYIDTVLQGSKSLSNTDDDVSIPWPFSIRNTTSPLLIGPATGQVKDILFTSTGDTVTEISVPIMRTGEDVSGNNRDGTWV